MTSLPRPQLLRRALSAAALLVALCCFAAPAASAHTPFHVGLSNPGGTSAEWFKQTRATGSEYVRVPLDWKVVAPETEPAHWNPEDPSEPAYDWGDFDEAVRNAVHAGLKPLLIVDGGPTWAMGCTSPPFAQVDTCDPNPEDLRQFAVAAARHYGGGVPGVPKVKYFQGLNEPNLSLFFFPQYETNGKTVSPRLYRTLINSFYSGIKSVSKSDVVVAAGLGPIEVGKYTIGPMKFARELLCMSGGSHPHPLNGCAGGVHFDVFAIHPYTTGAPTHKGAKNDVELGDLPKLQKLIAAADNAGHLKGMHHRTPLWITEFSYDTSPPDPGGLPMKIATRWVAESAYVAWKAGVETFFWFSLMDEPKGSSWANSLQSGFYFNASRPGVAKPKPSRAAWRFPFVAYPGKKLTYWGHTPYGRRGKVKVQILEGSHWRTVAHPKTAKDGTFSGAARTGYGRDEQGKARAVVHGVASPAFSMKPVPDFKQRPFG
jgi:hypothetical protein